MCKVKLIKYDSAHRSEVIQDIIAFWHTHNICPSAQNASEDINQWTSDGHELFLICTDDNIVGFVHIGRRGVNCNWLEDIFVRQEYRGRGIGSKAIDCIWEYIQAKGLDTLYLEVVPANIDAIKLYHRLGFLNLNTLTLNKSSKVKEATGEETIQGLVFKTYEPNI